MSSEPPVTGPPESEGDSPPSDPWDPDADEARSRDILPTIRNIWAWWGWTMAAVVALLMGVAVIGDILRGSILLDLVSFWPVFVIIAIATGIWFRKRREWSGRIGAALALTTLTVMLSIVALHLGGWGPLPSSVVVEGRAFAGGEARIDINAGDGTLIVGTADLSQAFRASLIPRGGDVGVARASGLESQPPAITLVQRGDPGLHRAQGWHVDLAESGRWVVMLEAGIIEADLRDTTVGDSVVTGTGSLRVDAVVPGSVLTMIGGPFSIEVPSDVGAGVVGAAAVPEDWSATETGYTSPAGSGGFLIQVSDEAQVTVTQR